MVLIGLLFGGCRFYHFSAYYYEEMKRYSSGCKNTAALFWHKSGVLIMESRKDLFAFLLIDIRSGHVVAFIITVATFLFLAVLPYCIIHTGNPEKDEVSWKILYYTSTYIYTLI